MVEETIDNILCEVGKQKRVPGGSGAQGNVPRLVEKTSAGRWCLYWTLKSEGPSWRGRLEGSSTMLSESQDGARSQAPFLPQDPVLPPSGKLSSSIYKSTVAMG